VRALADSPADFGLLGTPMNRCAKFDAASCILGGEIRTAQENKQKCTEKQ